MPPNHSPWSGEPVFAQLIPNWLPDPPGFRTIGAYAVVHARGRERGHRRRFGRPPQVITPFQPTPANEANRHALFEQLVRERCRSVLRFFVARGFPHPVAEELTQESLMKAWRGIDQLTEPGAKEAWLFRIAENVYKNHLKSLSRNKRDGWEVALDGEVREGGRALDFADPAPNVLTRAVQAERTRRFRAALDLLPAQMRRSVLFYLDGRSYREIARLLRQSEETVRGHLFQVRRRLKAALVEEQP